MNATTTQANTVTTTSTTADESTKGLAINSFPACFRQQIYKLAETAGVEVERLQHRMVQTVRSELGKAGFTAKKAGIVKVTKGFVTASYAQRMESGNLGGKACHPAVKFARECDLARAYSAEFPDANLELCGSSQAWIAELAGRVAEEVANAKKATAPIVTK